MRDQWVVHKWWNFEGRSSSCVSSWVLSPFDSFALPSRDRWYLTVQWCSSLTFPWRNHKLWCPRARSRLCWTRNNTKSKDLTTCIPMLQPRPCLLEPPRLTIRIDWTLTWPSGWGKSWDTPLDGIWAVDLTFFCRFPRPAHSCYWWNADGYLCTWASAQSMVGIYEK